MAQKHSLFIAGADMDIGHNLARFIISSEIKDSFKEIVCGGTDQQRLDDLKRAGLKTVVYNFQDKRSIVSHLKNMNVVYLVPPYMKHQPRDAMCVIDACKEANVSCVCLQSNLMCDKSNDKLMKQYVELERHLHQQQGIKHKSVVRMGHLTDTFLHIAPHTQKSGELPLPTGDRKFSPIRLLDVSRATAYLLSGKKQQHGVLVDSGVKEPAFLPEYMNDKVELTGPESLSGKEIVSRASQAIGAELTFKSVNVEEAKRILKESQKLDEVELCLIMEEYCLIRDGKYDHVSKDYEKIVGRQASKVNEFFEENARNFQPRKLV